jgi:hypothetical protein
MKRNRKYHALDIRRIREYESRGGIKSVIIDGVPPSTCIFCCKFTTSIYFDMDLHLYENHRTELWRLPIGKGFSIDSRIEYAIDKGRNVCEAMAMADGGLPRAKKMG